MKVLTCKELVELVTDYLEGKLPPDDNSCFEKHIAGCRNCTAYLEQMRTTIRLTGILSEDAITPPARDELLDIFRDWNKGQDEK